MPFKSDAQRRFFNSAGAKKAGIAEKEVAEFNATSKGKKLPERLEHKSANPKPPMSKKTSAPRKAARKSSQKGKGY